MGHKLEILFVQNWPERGVTAIEAFKPDPMASEMHIVHELEAIRYLDRDGEFVDSPTPELIVLDIEMPRKIQRSILKELKRSGRLDIPVVRLDHAQRR